MLHSSEYEARKKLTQLRREFNALRAELDQMSIDESVTDLKAGRLIKRHHVLEKMIKQLEDQLIPDMPA